MMALVAGPSFAADPPRQLTHDGTRKMAPVFTARGTQIVYSTHESPNLVALMRLELSDGTNSRLHPTVTAHQWDAAFSPDGKFHAYAMSSGSPQLVLVIQDQQAGREAVFRPLDARATARSPSIAPDGSRIAFSLSDAGGIQIATVNSKGEDLRRLTESAGMNAWPAFSPDGSQIAFGSSRDGDFEIYVMRADGQNVRRLTTSPGRDMRPAWSPDGQRLAFVSGRDGNGEIYVMHADGSHERNVTNHPDRDDFPAWHPDGKGVLCVSERSGQSDLYLFPADE